MIHLKKLFLVTILIFVSGCSSDSSSDDSGNSNATPTIIANLQSDVTYQTITGFGGANRMWGTKSLTPSEAQKAFGTGANELGLSMFRVRLSSNKNEWPIIVEAVKEANKRNVQVLASPWSPPAALKSNNSDIRGYLLPENYEAFKNYINEFITFMNNKGAKIDVVSIQNEPDWEPNYESCDWTAEQMINFLKAPGEITGARVAAPESLNFNQAMTNAILSDPEASAKIDVVAGHIYGSGVAEFPLAEQQQKEIWMTEWLLNLGTGLSGAASWSTYSEASKWSETLEMLNTMHDAMTKNWNAFIWWYLQRYYSFMGDGEQGTTEGAILKRGFAYSHFSKFIRPDFIRINIETSKDYLKMTAYKSDTQNVIVVINNLSYEMSNVELNNLGGNSVKVYTTSETVTMDKTELLFADQSTRINFAPKSITTIVIDK
jgi:O-glycosyl hydrolase